MADNNQINNFADDFRAFAGSAPTPIGAGSTNESYSSADGTIIYLNFNDDSPGLFPFSGIQSRFTINKTVAGSTTTVYPTSTFIDSLYPKTVQLKLNSSDKIIDGLYDTAGIVTSYQSVTVAYTNSTSGGFGTIPLLSDNDSVKTNVASFSGLGISNRAVETNGPVFLYAYSSTDGTKVYNVFREATPPLLPTSGIGGFAVSQSGYPVGISNAYVLDPTSSTNGKIVVLDLSSPLTINDGSNDVTVSYTVPSLTSTRLRDSTSISNLASGFAGTAVTNNTSETIAPRIVDAYTNVLGPTTIYVKMSEPTFPGTAVTGFSFYINGVKSVLGVSAAGNSTYLGFGVSEYTFTGGPFGKADSVEVDYQRPISNYVTDQSNNLNQLQSLTNKISVRNLWFASSGSTPVSTKFDNYLSSNSYVDVDGKTIYLYLDMPFGKVVTPTDLTGLIVLVDGQVVPIKNAKAQSDPSLGQIKITLYSRIYSGSTVGIFYIPGNIIGAGTNANVGFAESNAIFEITNNSFLDKSTLFDIFDWFNNTETNVEYEFDIDENTSELFRKTKNTISTGVIFDTEPPKGIVVLNKSGTQNEPGIKLHKFDVYGTEVDESGTTVDLNIASNAAAWKITNQETKNVTKITIKLKYLNSILNNYDFVRLNLYSNSSSNTPDTLIANLANVQFSDILTSYQEIELSVSDITLDANTDYWIAASCDNIVPVDINNTPAIYIATHTSEGMYIASSSTLTSSGWLVESNKSVYYKLFSINDNDTVLASNNYLLDIYEKPIREVTLHGSDTGLAQYELFGDENSNYIWKRLLPIYEDTTNHTNDIYPAVSKVEILASSAKPKNYILEVRTNPQSDWVQVFDTLTDDTTLDKLIYTFSNPTRISDLRLVYKGDYFTIDTLGNLTISAYDNLSDVTKAQISHFSDFRDANTFVNSDQNGFIDFSEGTTEFLNWNIANNSAQFKSTDGYASSDVLTAISNNSKIILASNNKIFTYYNGTTTSSTNDQIVDSNNQITCSAVYKNKIYIGTTSGLIYSSTSGDHWTVVNAINPLDRTSYKNIKPIKCMSIFADQLLIGTSKGTSLYPSIYSYDGFSVEKIKDFESTYEYVSCITSAYFNAYVGLGGVYSSGNSVIYSYNQVDWTLSLATDLDNVEAISYSTAKDSIIAAFRGGDIYELPFVNSLSTSWSKIYDIACDHIFSINDDPNGNYLSICGDLKTAVYYKSIDSFKVISNYTPSTLGSNVNWKKYSTYQNSYSSDLATTEDFTYEYYGVLSDAIEYDTFTQSGFASSSKSVIEGYIKAKTSGDYKFKIISNMGTKLTIGGISATSNYTTTNISSDTTLVTSRTYSLSENEYIDYKIESFVSAGTTASMNFYWKNVSGIEDYEIIPKNYLYRKSSVKNVLYNNSGYYGIGADGKVYNFDIDAYSSKRRNVYARIKDEAGNIHSLILPGRSEAKSILSDKIFQDLNTVENVYQTKGKIYQIEQNNDKSLETKVVFVPNTRQYSIYAPERKIREVGYYEAEPFFVPTLVKWNYLTNLIVNKYSINTSNGSAAVGLDAGTSVKVYVRTGSSRSDCLNSTWSDAYEVTYINNNSNIPTVETQQINLQNYNGKWFQYKFELTTATKNISPEVVSATITYTAGTASYYFTKIFDTTDYDTTAPVIRRGILTSNELLNNGTITYGYINTDDPADVYDFNKYKEIVPNQVFEIDSPTSMIKFGILFTSVGTTPAIVQDFAVQLDLGDSNIKFMPSL